MFHLVYGYCRRRRAALKLNCHLHFTALCLQHVLLNRYHSVPARHFCCGELVVVHGTAICLIEHELVVPQIIVTIGLISIAGSLTTTPGRRARWRAIALVTFSTLVVGSTAIVFVLVSAIAPTTEANRSTYYLCRSFCLIARTFSSLY